MTTPKTQSRLIARRGELMAELFFQELDPAFVSRPTTDDVGYDLLVGFPNKKAGTNTFAVQVRATEEPVESRFQIRRNIFNRMIHSNIPALLLVADVKRNRMYFAWLKSTDERKGGSVVSIPVTEINEAIKKELHEQLIKVDGGVAIARLA